MVNGQFVPENYTEKSDVYQLGIATYQVLCGFGQEELYKGGAYGNLSFMVIFPSMISHPSPIRKALPN